MNLIFMGTPAFAVPSLRKLIEAGHRIQAVFTQPDKPVGRKQVITPPPVKVCALEHGLTVYQPLKIKTAEARAEFEPLFQQADAGIVAAYGRILPDAREQQAEAHPAGRFKKAVEREDEQIRKRDAEQRGEQPLRQLHHPDPAPEIGELRFEDGWEIRIHNMGLFD